MILLDIRRMLAEVFQQARSLGYDKSCHVHDTDHATFFALGCTQVFAKVIGCTSAWDTAIGMIDKDDVFAFVLNEGAQTLANGVGIGLTSC